MNSVGLNTHTYKNCTTEQMCFVEKKLNEIKNYNPLQKEVSSFSLKSVKQKHPRVARASLSSMLHIRSRFTLRV